MPKTDLIPSVLLEYTALQLNASHLVYVYGNRYILSNVGRYVVVLNLIGNERLFENEYQR